jgi:methionine-gamma-lyase
MSRKKSIATMAPNKKSPIEQRLRDLQHFGEEGGVVPVIDLASTSTFLNPKDMEQTFLGEKEGCYLYSRHSNPTVNMFSQKMAALENTESALGVASGMAAIACTLEQIMGEGGEIISSPTIYGGTFALFKNVFPQQGIKTHFIDLNNAAAIEKAINKKTKLIYVETISNPLLNLAPLKALAQICKKHKLKFVVDNTFAPCLVTPKDFGADVVVHSCTKFISGSSDMIAGAICGSRDFINSLIDVNTGRVMIKGPTMDPRTAHELYMRLDHLPIRIKAHSQKALFFAEQIEKLNLKVIYPGLKSHPQHEAYLKQLNPNFGFGGMLAVEFGSADEAMMISKQLQNEKFGLYAVSLGFSRTLMTVPAITTSSEIPQVQQKQMKLSTGLIRFSIGFTGDDTIMLDRFLKVVKNHRPESRKDRSSKNIRGH